MTAHLSALPLQAALGTAGALSSGDPTVCCGLLSALQALLFMVWSLLTALTWRLVLAGNLQQVNLLGNEQRGSSPRPLYGD